MIVVKVELWPYGLKQAKSSIGEIRIWNTGTGDWLSSDYLGTIKYEDESEKKASVNKFRRELGAFKLISRFLKKFGES